MIVDIREFGYVREFEIDEFYLKMPWENSVERIAEFPEKDAIIEKVDETNRDYVWIRMRYNDLFIEGISVKALFKKYRFDKIKVFNYERSIVVKLYMSRSLPLRELDELKRELKGFDLSLGREITDICYIVVSLYRERVG